MSAGTILTDHATLSSLRPTVIGIGGKIATGKTTLTEQLSVFTGWRSVNLGQYLKKLLSQRTQETDRKSLQDFGAQLVNRAPEEFCHGVLSSVGWMPGEGLLIDGIRNVAVVEAFKKLVAPMAFILVFLQARDQTRLSRYRNRGQSFSTSLSEVERHQIEAETLTSLPQLADLLISSDQSIEREVEAVVRYLRDMQ